MATPTYKHGPQAGQPYRTHISNDVRCEAVRAYGPGRTRCWRRVRTTTPTGANVCYQCDEALKAGDASISTAQDSGVTERFQAFVAAHIRWTGEDEDFITAAAVRAAFPENIPPQRAGKILAAYVRSSSLEEPVYRGGFKGYLGFRLT